MDNNGMDNDGTIMTTMAWHQPSMTWRSDNDGMIFDNTVMVKFVIVLVLIH